jgi:hypothetical protein
MEVAIPHGLGREEARRRLRENSHKMAEGFPGGMAEVTTRWAGEDRLEMAISALGQSLTGHIDVADTQVLLSIELPAALNFVKPLIEGAVREQGRKMLAPPSS